MTLLRQIILLSYELIQVSAKFIKHSQYFVCFLFAIIFVW